MTFDICDRVSKSHGVAHIYIVQAFYSTPHYIRDLDINEVMLWLQHFFNINVEFYEEIIGQWNGHFSYIFFVKLSLYNKVPL